MCGVEMQVVLPGGALKAQARQELCRQRRAPTNFSRGTSAIVRLTALPFMFARVSTEAPVISYAVDCRLWTILGRLVLANFRLEPILFGLRKQTTAARYKVGWKNHCKEIDSDVKYSACIQAENSRLWKSDIKS